MDAMMQKDLSKSSTCLKILAIILPATLVPPIIITCLFPGDDRLEETERVITNDFADEKFNYIIDGALKRGYIKFCRNADGREELLFSDECQ